MAKTLSVALVGVEPTVVEIEAVVGQGFSGLCILGLPSDVVRDMRERLRAALEALGVFVPARRIVVNISPPEVLRLSRTPLEQLDFAVAACILRALAAASAKDELEEKSVVDCFAGELTLAGNLRPVESLLPFRFLSQRDLPTTRFLLGGKGLGVAGGGRFLFFEHLNEWWRSVDRDSLVVTIDSSSAEVANRAVAPSFERVAQLAELINTLSANPKAAVAVLTAAASGSHLVMAGEPGAGKSFSAARLPWLLPPLTESEAMERQLIESGGSPAETAGSGGALERPFRAPHHSTTSAALIGGASLRPGEITWAHRGVLFFDELAEFSRGSLESLREPLDSGQVKLSRAGGAVTYPARFLFCATTNPCPCGFLYSSKRPCRCQPGAIAKYQQKLSGPLLDRFPLQVWIGSPRKESKFDPFSAAFLSAIGDAGGRARFVSRFIDVQSRYFATGFSGQEKDDVAGCRNPAGRNLLSWRGQRQVNRLVTVMAELFEVEMESALLEKSVLGYREMESLLSYESRMGIAASID